MPEVDTKTLAVSRVYADAILQLAEARGEADSLQGELLDFAALVQRDAEFRTFLDSPRVDVAARRKSIDKLFRGRYSDLLVDSLQVLNNKDRLGLFCSVSEAYRLAHEEHRGRVEVYIRTAFPLTEQARAKLKEVATQQAGREADLVETVDESLLGGLIMQIGDRKLDASLAAKLKTLGDALSERASHEIHSGREYFERASG